MCRRMLSARFIICSLCVLRGEKDSVAVPMCPVDFRGQIPAPFPHSAPFLKPLLWRNGSARSVGANREEHLSNARSLPASFSTPRRTASIMAAAGEHPVGER